MKTSWNKLPVGTVRFRTRHGRGGEQRAWVKISEPNIWKLRAQVAWEAANGPIPDGMGVHHRDENKLNDAIENLELVSKAKHLEIHVPAYRARIVKNLVAHRRRRRWSTKSEAKHTGRPRTHDSTAVASAVAEYERGGITMKSAAEKHGVTIGVMQHLRRSM